MIHLSIFSLKNVITLVIDDHLTEKTSAGHRWLLWQSMGVFQQVTQMTQWIISSLFIIG